MKLIYQAMIFSALVATAGLLAATSMLLLWLATGEDLPEWEEFHT